MTTADQRFLRDAVGISLVVVFCLSGPLAPVQAQPPLAISLTPEEFQRQVQKAGDVPAQLARLLPFAPGDSGSSLRKKIFALLAQRRQNAARDEFLTLAQEMARLLPCLGQSPPEVGELLGDEKTVSRQVLYRKYLEHWRYVRPLPLVLTFECRRGQEPVLRDVQVQNFP